MLPSVQPVHVQEEAMKLIRLAAIVLVAALSLGGAPRPANAGSTPARTAKNCAFIRNNLPCPCPRAEQARAVAKATRVTVGALATAFRTTATALARGDQNRTTPQTASPAKR